ncbi:MAG: hypothetical protein Q8P18_02305 [Pseudomonadota bacterium]|nr:hypothetical protein [Pseudomonadota bacterium]
MLLARLVLAPVLARGAALGALVWIVVVIVGLGQALLTSAVVPDPDLLLRMVAGALGVGASVAVPLGALGGVAGGLGGMAEGRAWLGLRALGVGGRAVAAPVGLFLVAVVAVWLGITHTVEPGARALLRDARIAAAVRVVPVEGRVVRLGGWAAAVEGGVLHFAGGEWLGYARTWEVRPALTGVVVALGSGELRSTDGTSRARFATLEMPVPLTGSAGKVHASERTTPDLRRQLLVSAALGRDTYERWILWKRSLLPLCLLPLGLAAVPLGLGRRWPLLGIVAAQVVTLWGVVRVADQWVGTVGIAGAAVATLAAALLWVALAWRGWADG